MSISILRRYRDFMETASPSIVGRDETRLIFLQPDLAASTERSIQLHGVIRPPSSADPNGVYGMLMSRFVESELEDGEKRHRSQPFFLGEPFPITWIESAGSEVLFAFKPTEETTIEQVDPKLIPLNNGCGEDAHKKLIPIYAVWLWRSTDDSYTAVLVGRNYTLATVMFDCASSDPAFFGHNAVHAFLFELFQRLAKEGQLGNERVNERFKLGSGKGKTVVKVKDVIHIRARQKISGPTSVGEGRTIEWSHRWEVMGHWRKVRGIGKDDRGRYHVQGLTWVMPHTKGPEERELIKKTRVFLGPKGGAA